MLISSNGTFSGNGATSCGGRSEHGGAQRRGIGKTRCRPYPRRRTVDLRSRYGRYEKQRRKREYCGTYHSASRQAGYN